MEFWKDFNLTKPPVGTEVLAKCDEWIDEDFNKLGVRIGFLNEDENGPFISAKWNNYADHYETVESNPGGVMPMYWRYKDVEDNPEYPEAIRKMYMESIRDSMPQSLYEEHFLNRPLYHRLQRGNLGPINLQPKDSDFKYDKIAESTREGLLMGVSVSPYIKEGIEELKDTQPITDEQQQVYGINFISESEEVIPTYQEPTPEMNEFLRKVIRDGATKEEIYGNPDIKGAIEYLDSHRCKNSPAYFYNNYIRKPGEPEFTEDEYLRMINMARNPLKFRNPEHVERPFTPDECFAPPEPLVPKVGGNLYCNSGKRAPNSNIDVYVITKIGREYLYAEKPNLRRTVKMPIKSMAADMHNGTGYKQFFLSEQELLDHNEHSSLVSKLANNLSYLSLQKRTLKELREVANTLKL